MSTPYHAKYFAHELSRHHRDSLLDSLSHSLFDACIDLNPHQIEAALFALRSPLSKGAILADEVGLGKTIEAGLVICQFWAERKRKMVIICPAALRTQWSQEMSEKFHLPNRILDSRTFRQLQSQGMQNPFDDLNEIFIMSIHFASQHSIKLRTIDWDLAVIDEAHKLRNVFRNRAKMAQDIKWALEDRRKLLLTATPLQNSLMELYGLASLVDDRLFGDAQSFRSQFVNRQGDTQQLSQRLPSFVQRTLRNQVSEYIRYTKRRSHTLAFEPTDSEHDLYESMSDYIRQEDSYAIPHGQRHLMTLVMRKLLASSPAAITGTLSRIRTRLTHKAAGQPDEEKWMDNVLAEHELTPDTIEEELAGLLPRGTNDKEVRETAEIDPVRLQQEIEQLDALIRRSNAITVDTKAKALLKALDIGFREMEKSGALRKALIFTESRRTQHYLFEFLQQSGYQDQLVLFSGSNNDPLCQKIYQDWLEKNQYSGRVSGSRQVDMRTALIDHFRENATILIATEAAAEGINLQFCSLVINYDLPWNPQRIEQRIGRCHRYGQKHDVVVMNFLNSRNETDQRVYDLLSQKFHLFDGVFGASDEVLGKLESGLEFERRIHDIYQTCRQPDEIDKAFSKLQSELQDSIKANMDQTTQLLLEFFDHDVHERVRIKLDDARARLNRFEQQFWLLSKVVLAESAKFNDFGHTFELQSSPMTGVKTGRFYLVNKQRRNIHTDFLYRLTHPLGEYAIARGKEMDVPLAHVYFDISNHDVKISAIASQKGKSGWLSLDLLTIHSFDQEDHLIFSAFADTGKVYDQEWCERLFLCRAASTRLKEAPEAKLKKLGDLCQPRVEKYIRQSRETNSRYFNAECDKLDQWAEDVIIGAEKKLAENRQQINIASRQARLCEDAVQQHKIQVQLRDLEKQRRHLREKIFAIEDEILHKRDSLINKLEKRMAMRHDIQPLFVIRWTII